MTFQSLLNRTFSSILIAMGLSACGENAIDQVPPLPPYVQTYDIQAHEGSVKWLDNDRFWFSRFEYDYTKPASKDGFYPLIFSKGIQNTKTGEVIIYDSPPANESSVGWCYSPEENRLRYRTPTNALKEAIGPPGQEQFYQSTKDANLTTRNLSMIRCDLVPFPKITGDGNKRGVFHLLPGDGFFTKPHLPDKEPVLYHANSDDLGRKVPFDKRIVTGEASKYVSYRGAYFIAEDSTDPEKPDDSPNCKRAWWFWPKDFRWEPVCISPGGRMVELAPARHGFIMERRAFENDRRAGTSGLYLDLGPEKGRYPIVTGYGTSRSGFDVSPDGCKIVYAARSRGDLVPPLKLLNMKRL